MNTLTGNRRGRKSTQLDLINLLYMLECMSMTTAAQILGVHRNTIYNLLRQAKGQPEVDRILETISDKGRIQRRAREYKEKYLTKAVQRIVKPKRERARRLSQAYPYILNLQLDGAELVSLVDRLVPKELEHSIRADVCQDLIIAVLAGDIEKANLNKEAPKFIRRHFRQYRDKWGALQIDHPIPGDRHGLTLAEMLTNDKR